eukprot:10817548-Ditylum_brightwellii.AAC.2
MSDEDDDFFSLGKISVCSGDVPIGEAENGRPCYLLEDGKKKGDFSIDRVIKAENKILDCDSNIDADEIEDLHNMSTIAKEVCEIQVYTP